MYTCAIYIKLIISLPTTLLGDIQYDPDLASPITDNFTWPSPPHPCLAPRYNIHLNQVSPYHCPYFDRSRRQSSMPHLRHSTLLKFLLINFLTDLMFVSLPTPQFEHQMMDIHPPTNLQVGRQC